MKSADDEPSALSSGSEDADATTPMRKKDKAHGNPRIQKVNIKAAAGDDPAVEKMNALTGGEFEQNIPSLKDTDADFEHHWPEFKMSTLNEIKECHVNLVQLVLH